MGGVGHHTDGVHAHGGVSVIVRNGRAHAAGRPVESGLGKFRGGGELLFREEIGIELMIGMERDEILEVVGGLEFFQQRVERFFGVGKILLGRHHLPHHIFDVAVGRLLELLFAVVVVLADFVGRDRHGGVGIGDRSEHVIDVGGHVALGQHAGFFQIGQDFTLFEERGIFREETFAIDIFFEEGPQARILTGLVRIDGLDEIGQGFPAEDAVLVAEDALLQEDRGDVAALRQVEHFFVADRQARGRGFRDEYFIFEDGLPGRIAQLGLLLFRRGVLAHQLGNLGVGVELVVESLVRNGLAVHRTYLVV